MHFLQVTASSRFVQLAFPKSIERGVSKHSADTPPLEFNSFARWISLPMISSLPVERLLTVSVRLLTFASSRANCRRPVLNACSGPTAAGTVPPLPHLEEEQHSTAVADLAHHFSAFRFRHDFRRHAIYLRLVHSTSIQCLFSCRIFSQANAVVVFPKPRPPLPSIRVKVRSRPFDL